MAGWLHLVEAGDISAGEGKGDPKIAVAGKSGNESKHPGCVMCSEDSESSLVHCI